MLSFLDLHVFIKSFITVSAKLLQNSTTAVHRVDNFFYLKLI